MNKEVDIGGGTGVVEQEGPVKDGDKEGERVEDEDEDRGDYEGLEVSWAWRK